MLTGRPALPGRPRAAPTRSSSRSSSSPLPTASSSPAQYSTRSRPSLTSASVSRSPAWPESSRRMISSIRADRGLVRRCSLAVLIASRLRRRRRGSAARMSRAARAAAAEVDRLAGAVLDERVARARASARDRAPPAPAPGAASSRPRADRSDARARSAARSSTSTWTAPRAVRPSRNRAPGARPQLAEQLVQVPALAARRAVPARADRRSSARARSTIARRPWTLEPAGAGGELGAGGVAVDRDRGLGGVGRRRAADRGHVVDQRPVGVVSDRRDHRAPAAARPSGTAPRRRTRTDRRATRRRGRRSRPRPPGSRQARAARRRSGAPRGGPGPGRTPTRAARPSRAGAAPPGRRRGPCPARR